jgi:hypothetical protein
VVASIALRASSHSSAAARPSARRTSQRERPCATSPFQRHRAPALTSRSSRDSPAASASAGEFVAPNPIRSARTR